MSIFIWIALGILTVKLMTRVPKVDPTMGGRIVPVSTREEQAALHMMWVRHRAYVDGLIHRDSPFESPDQARARWARETQHQHPTATWTDAEAKLWI
jgi:hypothetical protein